MVELNGVEDSGAHDCFVLSGLVVFTDVDDI